MGSIKLINELRFGGGGDDYRWRRREKSSSAQFLIYENKNYFTEKIQVYVKGENDRMMLM